MEFERGRRAAMHGFRYHLVLVLLCLLGGFAWPALAAESTEAAALIVGNRQIAVFRAPVGAFTPAERAEAARLRIARAAERAGEGWTSVKSTAQGVQVELDGKTMFVL
ncbi:MAG: hypothetical protein JNJ60_22405, partial [Rhodocyclaceae bacterium]|nr:hypothetical protein [Rhodocyclaceae bacterium]